MERTFKRGDKVRLKSGGPVMTANDYEMGQDILGAMQGKQKPNWETWEVNCVWFEKTKQQYGRFHQDLLELVTG